MTTITLRSSKGSPLTNSEVDSNFSNLNNDKVEKTVPSAAGNLAALDASGQITDSGVNPNTKANKKTPSAAGNIASLDATGDLSDSGIAPSDVTNKTDKVAGAAAGNLAALDASGNLTDSTYSPSDFQPADPDIPTVAATTAEMQAGIETALRSMSPKNVADAIAAQAPATWDFESSPIPFTGASGAQKISAAHGLGVTPKKLEAVVRCLTASEDNIILRRLLLAQIRSNLRTVIRRYCSIMLRIAHTAKMRMIRSMQVVQQLSQVRLWLALA